METAKRQRNGWRDRDRCRERQTDWKETRAKKEGGVD